MRMRRRVWLVASAALLGALQPSIADAPDLSGAAFRTPAVAKDEPVRLDWPVRIDEQLVRVEQTGTSPDRERVPARRRSVRHRHARDNAESVMSHARRLLFGDGEARPEPFPKPR